MSNCHVLNFHCHHFGHSQFCRSFHVVDETLSVFAVFIILTNIYFSQRPFSYSSTEKNAGPGTAMAVCKYSAFTGYPAVTVAKYMVNQNAVTVYTKKLESLEPFPQKPKVITAIATA